MWKKARCAKLIRRIAHAKNGIWYSNNNNIVISYLARAIVDSMCIFLGIICVKLIPLE